MQRQFDHWRQRLACDRGGTLALLVAVACLAGPVAAEPVPHTPDTATATSGGEAEDPLAPAPPVPTPASEAAQALLEQHIHAHRRTLLEQSFQPRPPTWVQQAATVNLGDFPTLDDPTAKSERDIGTLEWLLQDQARQAAARRAGSGPGGGEPPPDRWWVKLLPGHWIPFLKTHRDQVLAGGTGVLLVWWLLAALSRRPLSARRIKARRRARTHRTVAAPATAIAPLVPEVPTLRKRRRRRHSSRHRSDTPHAPEPG